MTRRREKPRVRVRPARTWTWNDAWLWSQAEDHPQRLLAMPRRTRRRWARGKSEEDRRLFALFETAGARFVRSFLDGLKRSVR